MLEYERSKKLCFHAESNSDWFAGNDCLLYFFRGGGLALVQQISLSIVLALYGYARYRYDRPRNTPPPRWRMRRGGARYRFIHKLLQDHFAAMDLD